jgi:hypothetical protein
VGEQMLFDWSEEGDTPGLGLLPGKVVRFELEGVRQDDGSRSRCRRWAGTMCTRPAPIRCGKGSPTTPFLFVHSYYAVPAESRRRWADSYGAPSPVPWPAIISLRPSSTRKKCRGGFAAVSEFRTLETLIFCLSGKNLAADRRQPFFLLTSHPLAMLLIPAIDLKDGHCVRLKQGDMDQATVFSEDPAEMALHWLKQGARRLHLVDLNGAFAGKPKNEAAVKAILKAVASFAEENDVEEIPVQLGGGIRDLDTIERYLDDGLSYVIIGTAAVKNPGFLHDACSAFPATSSSAWMPRTARWPPMAGASCPATK